MEQHEGVRKAVETYRSNDNSQLLLSQWRKLLQHVGETANDSKENKQKPHPKDQNFPRGNNSPIIVHNLRTNTTYLKEGQTEAPAVSKGEGSAMKRDLPVSTSFQSKADKRMEGSITVLATVQNNGQTRMSRPSERPSSLFQFPGVGEAIMALGKQRDELLQDAKMRLRTMVLQSQEFLQKRAQTLATRKVPCAEVGSTTAPASGVSSVLHTNVESAWTLTVRNSDAGLYDTQSTADKETAVGLTSLAVSRGQKGATKIGTEIARDKGQTLSTSTGPKDQSGAKKSDKENELSMVVNPFAGLKNIGRNEELSEILASDTFLSQERASKASIDPPESPIFVGCPAQARAQTNTRTNIHAIPNANASAQANEVKVHDSQIEVTDEAPDEQLSQLQPQAQAQAQAQRPSQAQIQLQAQTQVQAPIEAQTGVTTLMQEQIVERSYSSSLRYMAVKDVLSTLKAVSVLTKGEISKTVFVQALDGVMRTTTSRKAGLNDRERAALYGLHSAVSENEDVSLPFDHLVGAACLYCLGSYSTKLAIAFAFLNSDSKRVSLPMLITFLKSVYKLLLPTTPPSGTFMQPTPQELAETTALQCFEDNKVSLQDSLEIAALVSWFSRSACNSHSNSNSNSNSNSGAASQATTSPRAESLRTATVDPAPVLEPEQESEPGSRDESQATEPEIERSATETQHAPENSRWQEEMTPASRLFQVKTFELQEEEEEPAPSPVPVPVPAPAPAPAPESYVSTPFPLKYPPLPFYPPGYFPSPQGFFPTAPTVSHPPTAPGSHSKHARAGTVSSLGPMPPPQDPTALMSSGPQPYPYWLWLDYYSRCGLLPPPGYVLDKSECSQYSTSRNANLHTDNKRQGTVVRTEVTRKTAKPGPPGNSRNSQNRTQHGQTARSSRAQMHKLNEQASSFCLCD